MFFLRGQNTDCFIESFFSMDREQGLFLRGLAILMILLLHTGYLFGEGGVVLFLIISGYGIELSTAKNGTAHFLRKRIIKVWLPYFPVGLLALFLRGVVSPDRIVCTILGLDFHRIADRTMWFISYILAWYLAFFCAANVSNLADNKFIRMIIRILFLLLAGFLFRWLYLHGRVWHENSGVDNYTLAFPLGVLLANCRELLLPRRIKRAFWSLTLLLSMTYLMRVYPRSFHVFTNYTMAFLAISTTQVFLLDNYWITPIKWLGKYSFPIYLFEGLILGYRNSWFSPLGSQLLTDLMFIAVSALVAVLYWEGFYHPLQELFRIRSKNERQ